MLFAIIIIVLFAVVTYFHYIQGGFTAVISAGCAFFALCVAFGYYEYVAGMFSPGRFADYMPAMLLIGLFGVTYIVLRAVVDGLVPGNISLPLYVDRIGAVLFGAIAAAIGVGIFAVGAQLMPFGPDVGGHVRYEIRDRTGIIVPAAIIGGRGSDQDAVVKSEVITDVLDPANAQALLLPIDDFAVSLAGLASDNSLGAGGPSLRTIHPDLLGQAFINRTGPQLGGKRVVLNTGGVESATLVDVFTVPGAKLLDTEIPTFREASKSYSPKLPEPHVLVAFRVNFSGPAADSDGFVRIPQGSVRLVTDEEVFHAIGTGENAGVVGAGRLDDVIVIPLRGDVKGADFVFAMAPETLERIAPSRKFEADAGFLEIKMFGRLDIGGRTVTTYKPDPTVKVLRKKTSPVGAVASPPAN
ncbi:MAG TPA: CvpA family protein [Tepidisphaeraceae bacterium]|jgi:hypothetical protein